MLRESRERSEGVPGTDRRVIRILRLEHRLLAFLLPFGGLVIAMAFVVGASAGLVRTSAVAVVEIAGIIGAVVGLPLLFTVLIGEPDSMELDRSGVTFRTLAVSTRVPWTRFDRVLKESPKGDLAVTYRTSDRPAGRYTGYAVVYLPPPLARPLLTHPGAPKWSGPPGLWAKWLPEGTFDELR